MSKVLHNSDNSRAERSAASAAPLARLRLILLSAVGGALVAAVAAAGMFFTFGGDAQAKLPVIGAAPHYQLIDQNGRSVSSQDFAGKVRIVAPLFPYCRELCPLVAANLAEFDDRVVQRSPLKGRVVFVFFNVAPADSGLPEMRQFLKQYGWNPNDPAIEFLTGSPQAIKDAVQHGFHIGYYRTQGAADDEPPTLEIRNALADRVKPDFDIKHADILEVVDGKGRIRKIFTSGSRVSDMRLESVVASLETNASGS